MGGKKKYINIFGSFTEPFISCRLLVMVPPIEYGLGYGPEIKFNPNPKTDPNPILTLKVEIMYAVVQNDTKIKFNIVL